MVHTEEKSRDTMVDEKNQTEESVEEMKTESKSENTSEAVSSEMAKKDGEIALLKEQILRSRADFDNFRKRCIKTEEMNRKLAVKDFAVDVITINDNLIRASEAALQIAEGQSLDQAHKSYVDGIMMISKSIEQALAKHGVEEIDSMNCPFNPMFHEAIEFDTSSDVVDDTVTRVHQKGFKIDTFVVRTAKVKVTKPEKKTEVSEGKESAEQ
jgi:molecular chaperone GrpE